MYLYSDTGKRKPERKRRKRQRKTGRRGRLDRCVGSRLRRVGRGRRRSGFRRLRPVPAPRGGGGRADYAHYINLFAAKPPPGRADYRGGQLCPPHLHHVRHPSFRAPLQFGFRLEVGRRPIDRDRKRADHQAQCTADDQSDQNHRVGRFAHRVD